MLHAVPGASAIRVTASGAWLLSCARRRGHSQRCAHTRVIPENAAATHAYLLAMNSYEETQVADEAHSIATIEAAGAQIAGECPGVLAGGSGRRSARLRARRAGIAVAVRRSTDPPHEGRTKQAIQTAAAISNSSCRSPSRAARLSPTGKPPKRSRTRSRLCDGATRIAHASPAHVRQRHPGRTRAAGARRVFRHQGLGRQRLQDACAHIQGTRKATASAAFASPGAGCDLRKVRNPIISTKPRFLREPSRADAARAPPSRAHQRSSRR